MQHKNCCQFSLRSIIYNSAASCRELNPYVDLQHIFIYLCEMSRLYQSLKVCIDIEHDQKSKVIVRNIFFPKNMYEKSYWSKAIQKMEDLKFSNIYEDFFHYVPFTS